MESFSFKESMATLQSLVSLILESLTLEDQLCIQHCMLKDLHTLKRDFGSLKQPGAFFSGTASEIFGKDALPIDKFTRSVGYKRLS
jgi:hypothetical protein